MTDKNISIISCCRSGHNFIKEQIKSWTDDIIFNFEDTRPINYEISKKYMASNGNLFDFNNKTINIIVVRDLLNWWASYLKWITKDGVNSYLASKDKLNNAFSIWNDQVKEAYGITNYISDKICIDYDTFNKSQKFRKSICKLIGGNYNEKQINEVVASGGGSSFDKQSLPGTKLKTDTRYKQILDSDLKGLYLDMLNQNQESVDIYTQYFELTLEQQYLINNYKEKT